MKLSDEHIRLQVYLVLDSKNKISVNYSTRLFLMHMVSNSENAINYNESVYCAHCIKERKELINLNY